MRRYTLVGMFVVCMILDPLLTGSYPKDVLADLATVTDAEIRGVARTGGVIGIGYWDAAICGTS